MAHNEFSLPLPTADTIGEHVRALRALRGMSQAELAGLANCTRTTVVRVEAGKISPRWTLLARLLEALDSPLAVRG